MSSASGHGDSAHSAARLERRWATISLGILVLLILMAGFAGIHKAIMPQARVETVDPRTLHLAGEFIESNLGTAVEPNGSVTVRAVAQQYSFSPPCILVPADTPIAIRATSADVVHGFIIGGTNVNTMLVPGYVSLLDTRFDHPADHLMPCHEFCGVGHEGMWAKVKVIDKSAFRKMAADRRRLACDQ
jgi:cytochrome c oxidase subunit II